MLVEVYPQLLRSAYTSWRFTVRAKPFVLELLLDRARFESGNGTSGTYERAGSDEAESSSHA